MGLDLTEYCLLFRGFLYKTELVSCQILECVFLLIVVVGLADGRLGGLKQPKVGSLVDEHQSDIEGSRADDLGREWMAAVGGGSSCERLAVVHGQDCAPLDVGAIIRDIVIASLII